jgi:iron complex outermembrane receptor protein
VLSADVIAQSGARRLADLNKLDISVSDAYNAVGYQDFATVRGFVLNPTYNYRREGLPISAETAIPLENRERIEVLKGTSGIQAGTSAPGGLLNFVIKRPTQEPLRTVRAEITQGGGTLLHLDLGGRTGDNQALGYRLNAVTERLRPSVVGADGERHLLALATDWRLSRDTLLEADIEHSRRSQPSVPGLSLLGNTLPAANPAINLNNQPWSQPVVMNNLSGSVGIQQHINSQWRWQGTVGTQRLKTDDRVAYPYGCYEASTGNYFADRYCPNGDVDLYDYRSLNERRTSQGALAKLTGDLQWGAVRHQVGMGVLISRYTERGEPQADNNSAVGTANIFTLPTLPPDATFSDPYTNRTERSTELFVQDAIQWAPGLHTWLGLRHSQIDRATVRSDGSRPTQYDRSFTTPWLAISWQATPGLLAYASAGKGAESEVAPGRSRYTNANQVLPLLESRQVEAGIKAQAGASSWTATVFRISRPAWGDLGSCGAANTCTRQADGDAVHQGLELTGSARSGPWSLEGGVSVIHARRSGSVIDPTVNGQRPTNVPDHIVRLGAAYRVAAMPGLSLHGHLSHEGSRSVVPDGSITLPAWTRVDTAARLDTRIAGHKANWQLSVDNLANLRFFQESPYQYSHVYLFPAAPRTVRLGISASF